MQKNINLRSSILFLMLLLASTFTFANNDNHDLSPEDQAKIEQLQAEADQLMLKVEDLKAQKKEASTRAEKKAIKAEIQAVRGELKDLAQQAELANGGIYIGSTALIVIILLLILL